MDISYYSTPEHYNWAYEQHIIKVCLEHSIEAVALTDEGVDLSSMSQELFEKTGLKPGGQIKIKPYQVNSIYQAVAIVHVAYKMAWENACLAPFWGRSTFFLLQSDIRYCSHLLQTAKQKSVQTRAQKQQAVSQADSEAEFEVLVSQNRYSSVVETNLRKAVEEEGNSPQADSYTVSGLHLQAVLMLRSPVSSKEL